MLRKKSLAPLAFARRTAVSVENSPSWTKVSAQRATSFRFALAELATILVCLKTIGTKGSTRSKWAHTGRPSSRALTDFASSSVYACLRPIWTTPGTNRAGTLAVARSTAPRVYLVGRTREKSKGAENIWAP